MQNKDIIVFPWSQNFETGIERIDNQHKELVSILNRLASTIVNDDEVEVESVFQQLSAYTEFHFSEEEKIWSEYFPEDGWLNSHRSSHASFLPNAMKIKETVSDKSWQEITEQVIQFLIRWLAFHILDDDKKMSYVIHEMNAGKSFSDAQNLADVHMSGSIRVLIDTVLGMYDELSSHAIELIRERKTRVKVEGELRLANQKLEQLSITDELSGLFNRRYFNKIIPKEFQRAVRENALISFISLDLDHFKSVNDRLGHAKGDEAIVETSTTITNLCRRAGDFAFRMGGEEFLVVVCGSSSSEVLKLAERIRKSIETVTISCDDVGQSHQLTISVGVFSHVPTLGSTAEFYLKQADEALYKAKSSGRNVVIAANDLL